MAVAEWLRRHPDVEGGPSVRGTMAFAEVASAWCAQTGADGLLAAALVTLPHRLRVRPGADPDLLVRLALAGVEAGEAEAGGAGGGDDDPVGQDQRGTEPAATVSAGHDPDAGDEGDWPEIFNDAEARRLLADLLPPPPAEPLSSGPAATRPGRRSLDDEVVAVRALRPGDRARDFSVRHTIRAAGPGGLGAGALRALDRANTARYDVAVVLDVSASMGQEERPLVAPACAALARVLIRDGHRVGSVAFCEEAVTARRLSAHPGRLFPVGGYDWAYATNVEEGLEAGRRLLTRHSPGGRRRHLILVTDAEATSFNNPAALQPVFPGRGQAWGFGRSAFMTPGRFIQAAQAAALRAATRCARQAVTVSVLYPDENSHIDFAARLAAAGGGRCRPLR